MAAEPTGRTLSFLMPGSSGAPENSSNNLTSGMATSINGNLPFASMLQDGATTTLPMSQNSDVTVFETTAEVKVSASAFSAQYGVGDVVYNQITKSGTDQFHGAGYEFFQNNALNAAHLRFRHRDDSRPSFQQFRWGCWRADPQAQGVLLLRLRQDHRSRWSIHRASAPSRPLP